MSDEQTLKDAVRDAKALSDLAACKTSESVMQWVKKHERAPFSFAQIDIYRWIVPQLVVLLRQHEKA